MGIKTKIEWADSSVNPIMGCTGCALRKSHCYAAALCARYAGRKGWPLAFDQPKFFPGRLEQAVNWSDLTGKTRPDEPWLNGLPRRIFVNDLSDGFCPDVDPWHWLAPSIPLMHLSSHIWMLLTKWPDRMCKFFEEWNGPILSNFHLGVSVENQAAADERIPWLLQTPAAVHYVNVEPMLGPVYLKPWLSKPFIRINPEDEKWNKQLDWTIAGGESGPGARPMDWGWVRDLRDQCQSAGVAFFLKQGIIGGKMVKLPELDGRQWREFPNAIQRPRETQTKPTRMFT